jgi:AcrR family transcriptional regulator
MTTSDGITGSDGQTKIPGRRVRSRRKEARPGEILAAASALFTEKGFAATRMDDVAARAGVSKGTLYLYFPSKEELFKALVRTAIVPNVDRFAALAPAFPGKAADLIRMIVTAVGDITRDPAIGMVPKVLIGEAGNFPDITKFYADEVIGRALTVIAAIIDRGVAAGEFRSMAGKDVAPLVIAPLLLMAVWRHSFQLVRPDLIDPDAVLANHLDTLLRGFAADKTEERA